MIDTSSYSTNTSSTTSTLKLGFCRARNSDITIYFPLVTLPRAGYIKFIKDLFLISPMRVSVRPLSPTCCSYASSAISILKKFKMKHYIYIYIMHNIMHKSPTFGYIFGTSNHTSLLESFSALQELL